MSRWQALGKIDGAEVNLDIQLTIFECNTDHVWNESESVSLCEQLFEAVI